jgi:hypothetical protein
MEYGLFTYIIEFELNDDYKLISSGQVSNTGNIWEIEQNTPFFDIPLVISNRFKNISVGKSKVKIYYLTLGKKNKKEIKKTAKGYYNHLDKMFGKSSTENLVLAVNKYNRSISYSRKGFISLSIGNSFNKADEKTLAHEIAHLWWNKADVNIWEDWLNESFAEYSAIILQRKQYGEDYFIKRIIELEEKKADLPSLYELKTENKTNQETITYKGAYLLYELENKIGRKPFEQLLKNVHQNRISKTIDFLDIIKYELGIEIMEYVKHKLNE